MNAQQLFLAGRMLTRLGRRAMRGEATGTGTRTGTGTGTGISASARTVLADALVRPDSAIGEIAERTGFLQSHVSAAVAGLREAGLVTTVVDPKDARRTLVRPLRAAAVASEAAAPQSPGSLDTVLVQALTARLGAAGARHVVEVTRALEVIVNGLGPEGARGHSGRRRRPRMSGHRGQIRTSGSRT